MSRVTAHLSISLDGFIAGPDQTMENPIGVGGLKLHQWHFDADVPGHEADADMRDRIVGGRGAFVMGRNMYGPIRGEWDGDWRGWWGEDPPYHAPVFVLTHFPHEPIPMQGGTTFHFVTDGVESALEQARAAAGDRDVDVAGGASAVRQAFAAGAMDELTLDIVPVLLGRGERLFDGVDDPGLEPVEVVHSTYATHVRYRVGGS
jgi:dihydrofolate reductase